jgi:hypothetical protein
MTYQGTPLGDQQTPPVQLTGNLPNAEYRRFEGMREYEALIGDLIPRTQRAIRVFDQTLAPTWNSPERFEILRQFLLANRANRLLIVVHDAEPIERERPRMVELVRQFGTAVRIHQTLSLAKQVYDPFVVFDANHYLHRFHYRFLRAAHGANDLVGARELLDRFSEIWDASTLVVSAGTSGL